MLNKKALLAIGIFLIFVGGATGFRSFRSCKQFERVRSLPVLSDPHVPSRTIKIVTSYPHDKNAFTEGFEYYRGFLYEGTGRKKNSTMRKIEITTGKILEVEHLPDTFFGEGITIFKDKIYQLTWKAQKCLLYDVQSMKKTGELTYEGQGWGLTHDAHALIMSDRTSVLRFFDPETFTLIRSLKVRLKTRLISNLNELEYVDGTIYANIYGTNTIARINAATGNVTGFIDIRPVYGQLPSCSRIGVPNGIAYNPVKSEFYLTGKFWNKLFRVKIIDP